MHIAVDFDNAFKLENRLDDGRGDETKQLAAKGTGALRRHNLQAPILDEALANNVHVVGRLSGLT